MIYLHRNLSPDPPLTVEEFARILKKKGEDRVKVRAYAIHLVSQGKTIREVAKILGKSEKTIRSWIKAWNERGIEGLKEEKGGKKTYTKPRTLGKNWGYSLRKTPENKGRNQIHQEHFWD